MSDRGQSDACRANCQLPTANCQPPTGDRQPGTVQRLRIVFAKGPAIKYVSHLDLLRTWERALRRAQMPLAYSHGFNPRPRLFFAAALPVGCTGSAEMLDVVLEKSMDLRDLASRLKGQLPSGLQLRSLSEVAVALPPLPSQVIAAEYKVLVETSEAPDAIKARLDGLLSAPSIPRRRERPDRVRTYDLRPLVQELRLAGRQEDGYVIHMRLQADAQGTGRPDEVMSALGMANAVRAIERTQLICKAAGEK